MPTDLGPPLLTGDFDLQLDLPSGMPFAPHLVADGSYPFAITALSPKVDVGEAK